VVVHVDCHAGEANYLVIAVEYGLKVGCMTDLEEYEVFLEFNLCTLAGGSHMGSKMGKVRRTCHDLCPWATQKCLVLAGMRGAIKKLMGIF
jgi:hypothetical protein